MPRPQFSIRTLLWLTLVVAIVFTIHLAREKARKSPGYATLKILNRVEKSLD